MLGLVILSDLMFLWQLIYVKVLFQHRTDFPFYVLFRKIIYILVGLPGLGSDRRKIWAKREKCLIFPGLSKRMQPKCP